MKIKYIITSLILSITFLSANSFVKLATPIKAMDFALQNSEEQTIKFSTFKGKPIILNFWATWCPPCKREMPTLQKFYKKYKNTVEVVAVASGQGDDDVFPFVSQITPKLTFHILYDETSIVSRQYNIEAMPTSFLINKDGFITHYAIGEIDFMGKKFLDLIK